jgi:hypothetical protein
MMMMMLNGSTASFELCVAWLFGIDGLAVGDGCEINLGRRLFMPKAVTQGESTHFGCDMKQASRAL